MNPLLNSSLASLPQVQSMVQSPLATPATADVGASSPLAGQAEQTALNTLLNIIAANNPSGSPLTDSPGTTNAENNPKGDIGAAPSTGSLMGDLAAARGAMPNAALSTIANPIGLATAVPATMAALGLNQALGLAPAKSIDRAYGLRGFLNQLQNIPETMRTRALSELPGKDVGFTGVPGYTNKDSFGDQSGSKPDSLGAAEAAAQAAAAAASGDFGGDKGAGAASDNGGGKGDSPADGGSKGDAEGWATGGLVALSGGGKLAIGPGSGLDDLIPTTIDGRRAAALSDGEFVIPADVVSMFGDGSSNAGAQRLYDLVKSVRQNKTGSDTQAGPLPVGEILRRTLR